MRVLVVLLVVAVLAGVLFSSMFFGSGGSAPSPTPKGPTAPPAGAHQAAQGLPAGTVATRSEVAPRVAENLANAPTACIQVVDHATDKPVPGAEVRRIQGGATLSFTDEHGLAQLPLPNPEQLAVAIDGYLLRLVPTQLGSTEQEPQQVRLVRDEWSMRRRLHFVRDDGKPVANALVRFRPNASVALTPPVSADDKVLWRAWSEHVILAARPAFADIPVQLGSYDQNRVHHLADGAEVRFYQVGDYVVEVATVDGLAARTQIHVDKGDTADVRIELFPGAYVDGTVVRLDGSKPLADAKITLEGGDPLGLVSTTGSDGTFRFGPLMPGPVMLQVSHPDMEPLACGPNVAPVSALRIEMHPLVQSIVKGRVRSRPGLEPIAAATVMWVADGGGVHKTSTGADGTFAVAATGSHAGRLMIQAAGHLALSELVEPAAAFQEYDLWPADAAVRIEKGATAQLSGVVLDNVGRPVPNINVRWQPTQKTVPSELSGRRVLDGGVLRLPPLISSGADGSFHIETDQFGLGRVLCSDGVGLGVEAQAIAGKITDGLRLQR